jgi:putative addiction module component (TIGR02574 family)
MTRPELAATIRSLPQDEKLDLLGELWDELDHMGPVREWHKEELDRRLDDAGAGKFVPWSEARVRILGSS